MLNETYKNCRQNLTVPATAALYYARYAAELEAWKTATGFRWETPSKAVWKDGPLEFTARLEEDPNGWFEYGDNIGKFVPYWIKGAVATGNGPKGYQWFLSADKEQPHANFRRAKSYGDSWWYAFLTVEASINDTVLCDDSLYGIEFSDNAADRQYVEEYIHDMTGTVAAGAFHKLRKMCEAVLPS